MQCEGKLKLWLHDKRGDL